MLFLLLVLIHSWASFKKCLKNLNPLLRKRKLKKHQILCIRRLSSEELMLLYCGAGEDSCTARSNQSILKEINPEYSLGELMLKLKLQYFGHLMWRADSLEKTLILGKTESTRRRVWQRMRWLITSSVDLSLSLSNLQEVVKDREAWRTVVHTVTQSQTWLSNWKTTTRKWNTERHNSYILILTSIYVKYLIFKRYT